MKKITTLIVDDEKESRKLLKIMLDDYSDLSIVGEASSALEAIKEIARLKPNVVFLDIQMPNGTGFDVLEAIPDRDFEVVFLTAHSDYAIQAIRAKACDYLIKPLDPTDLSNAVERISKSISGKQVTKQPKVLAVPSREGLILINHTELLRLEGDGSYTHIHKINGEKLVASQNLKTLGQNLDDRFMRVHNSHIICIEHVVKLLKDDGIICMKDGSEIPLARRKRKEFLDLFSQV